MQSRFFISTASLNFLLTSFGSIQRFLTPSSKLILWLFSVRCLLKGCDFHFFVLNVVSILQRSYTHTHRPLHTQHLIEILSVYGLSDLWKSFYGSFAFLQLQYCAAAWGVCFCRILVDKMVPKRTFSSPTADCFCHLRQQVAINYLQWTSRDNCCWPARHLFFKACRLEFFIPDIADLLR